MKNKDIKQKLRVLADKEEIKDFSNEIISKVDTSNVYLNKPAKVRHKAFKFVLSGTLATACAVLLVALGISVGLNNNTHSNSIVDDSDDVISYVSKEDVIKYLDDVETKEYYNMVNVASNLDEFTKFYFLEKSSSKELSTTEEEVIVSNISAYIYNMEDMFGLLEKDVKAFYKENKIDNGYKYDLQIDSSYYSYHVYYNETVINQKELDGQIVKLNSNTEGKIVLEDVTYAFTGNKIIKNNKITFTTKILIDENKTIEISETFGEKENEYIYSFVSNSKTVKKIEVVDKLNTEGVSEKIKTNYIWINGELDSKTNGESNDCKIEIDFTKGTDSYIDGAFKSKNKNHVYINKTNNTFTYTFKNSKNKY